MTPISLSKLEMLHHRVMVRGCPYVWGAKPPVTADSAALDGSDCSGYSRWLIARSTDQGLVLPEGSADQRHWCASHGLHALGSYADIARYAAADRLFACFIAPTGEHAGHVWLCRRQTDGSIWTHECYGGHGVGSRLWNTPVLVREYVQGFELPAVA